MNSGSRGAAVNLFDFGHPLHDKKFDDRRRWQCGSGSWSYLLVWVGCADFVPFAGVPSQWISATSGRSRACATIFRFLEKTLRPSTPALRDARNAQESFNLSSISSVNSKYVSNRHIVIRQFEDPNLISSADRALKNDAQVCPRSQRFGKTAHKPLIVHPNSQPPARDPWFGYFKHGGADRPTLAN